MRRNGAGILDVEQLLAAELPETPHGAGMSIRASASPKLTTYMDEIAALLPDVTRDRVHSGLMKFLNTDEDGLRRILREHGDEIVFHVATNPEVRAAISAKATRKQNMRAGAKRRASIDLTNTASREIRKIVAGRGENSR